MRSRLATMSVSAFAIGLFATSCSLTDITTVDGALQVLSDGGYRCKLLQRLALPADAVAKEAATCVLRGDEVMVITFATVERRSVYELRLEEATADFASGALDHDDFGSHPELDGVGNGEALIGATWYLSGIASVDVADEIVRNIGGVRLENFSTVTSGGSSACAPGYSPCLAPAVDYDCAGGSGNGPAFTGRVLITGSDIYGLDADGDGVGCE